jgi:hypothetical protein
MDASKLQLKIFTAPSVSLASEAFIPVFHAWIKNHTLPELMVDVANYAHVPHGPGVVLIGHGTDYGFDEAEDRKGLLFNRKRQAPAPEERLQDTFRRTLHAAVLLEKDPAFGGQLKFATDEFLLRFNDRLLAPNNDATWAAVSPEIEAFATKLFGAGQFSLARTGEPRQLFGVTIKCKAPASLAALLEKTGGPL